MITLNAQDKTKLEAALARAEAADLKLTVLYQSTTGAHYVVDSDHSRHQVYIWLEGDRAAYECDCTAHVERSLICRCAAAALKDFQEKLEAAKVAPAPVDMPDCNGCWKPNCPICFPPAPAGEVPAALLLCPDCGLDNSDMPGGDDGLEYCYNCGADLHPVDASLPEIDFDANPDEQQCQNCLRLWVNDTEFAYKVCPDCRSKSRWAHWDEVEAAEALNPEPEHTRYEESIASANYSQIEAATEAPAPVEPLECIKPGCHAVVEGQEAYCFDHQLEMAATYSDLFGD
jgi:hypothetical protein